MIFAARTDELAALQFEDLASALEAGLSLQTLGGDPSAGDQVVTNILQRRGVATTPTEQAMFAAGWQSGRIGRMLQYAAEHRRLRAAQARALWQNLRYPLLLVLFATLASWLIGSLLGRYDLPLMALTAVCCLALAALWLRRSLRTAGPTALRLPLLGPLLAGHGELRYLEAMHGLYAAGIPLPAAHTRATGTVPVPGLRQHLLVAERILNDGHSLTEALQQSLSLHQETRQLLATGEQTGTLEDALLRALTRRRQVVERNLHRLTKGLGAASYTVAALFCVVYILWVYSSVLSTAYGGR